MFPDITQTIGVTPLVRLNRMSSGLPATVLSKQESFTRSTAQHGVSHFSQIIEDIGLYIGITFSYYASFLMSACSTQA